MKVVTKREIIFTATEAEAATSVNRICDKICQIMDNDCKNGPLNEFCGNMETFLQDVEIGCVTIEMED